MGSSETADPSLFPGWRREGKCKRCVSTSIPEQWLLPSVCGTSGFPGGEAGGTLWAPDTGCRDLDTNTWEGFCQSRSRRTSSRKKALPFYVTPTAGRQARALKNHSSSRGRDCDRKADHHINSYVQQDRTSKVLWLLLPQALETSRQTLIGS